MEDVYHRFDERKVLVTGGAGFIGSHLVETLLTKTSAALVRVVDNLSTGNRENLRPFESDPRLEFVWGDLADLETSRRVTKGIDFVTHQAALGSVPRSIDDPITSHRSNVDATLNLFQACVENKVEKVVYASSSSVYGDSEQLPKVEPDTGNPLSPYAVTKCVGELYGGVFWKCYRLPTIGLRYFNVFGPRQDPKGPYAAVIPKFLDSALKGEPLMINGDGSNSRDFTFVANAVSGNLRALVVSDESSYGRAFNVGANGRVTLLELAEAVESAVGRKIEVRHRAPRVGDIPHSNADTGAAREAFGYEPLVPFDEGIAHTWRWFTDGGGPSAR